MTKTWIYGSNYLCQVNLSFYISFVHDLSPFKSFSESSKKIKVAWNSLLKHLMAKIVIKKFITHALIENNLQP